MLDDIVSEYGISDLPTGTMYSPLDILIDSRDQAMVALELVSGGEQNYGTVA